MRDLNLLDAYRRSDDSMRDFYGSSGDESCGVFQVPSPIDQAALMILASSGGGWDHVSVSHTNRCPNWPEMSHIRTLFFRNEECVMQLHVPKSEHINAHPFCLHLWRPQAQEIPRPPAWMITP
jgi:hypothetical protein